MANLAFSALVADARGSIGGVVLSRGRGGPIARARVKPINPRSTLQAARRASVAYLMKYWSNTLTEQQRTDWRAYAAGTSWTNKLGQSIAMNANSAFLRLNNLQRLIPSIVIAEAPTAMGHAGGIEFTFLAENDTSKIQVAEPTGDFDKNLDIQTLWLFMGLPTEPGNISKPKGFKYIGRIWGSSGAPLSFPYELDAAYTMHLGQRVTIYATFQDEHYRVSGPHMIHAVAAPSI